MARATHKKLLRKFGGFTKKGQRILPGQVGIGEKKKIPMVYKNTTMMITASQGQLINPRKEYERQMGITAKSKKRARRLRNKSKKNNA